MGGVVLREATEEDVGTILGFIRELADYEKLSHEVVATEEKLKATLFGDNPGAEVLLAEHDGTPAGFALFFPNYSTFLAQPGIYLEDLYVKPEFRGKGIGQALLRRLAQIALDRDCGRLEWWVLDWNEPALRFYEKLGAESMTDWTVQRVSGEGLRRLAADG